MLTKLEGCEKQSMGTDNRLISLHNHSHHSFDAKFSMECMVKSAISRGLTHFAFSEHQDFDKSLNEYLNLDFVKYKNEFDNLHEKYKQNINLYLSVEIDWQSKFSNIIKSYISTISEDVDFLIGSIHYIDSQAIDLPTIKSYISDNSQKLDSLITLYFNEYLSMVESGFFSIATHFDLFKLYMLDNLLPHPSWIKKYEQIIFRIFNAMKKNNIILEYNSAGFKKNLNEGYPCRELLKMYYDNGNRLITWSDDAHSPDEIGKHFDKISILREIGFKTLAVPSKNGIVELNLWA